MLACGLITSRLEILFNSASILVFLSVSGAQEIRHGHIGMLKGWDECTKREKKSTPAPEFLP